MVVVVDGLAASGGYIAAMASDHIIAQSSSLVGSIGVLFQYPNFTDLLKTVGVKVEEIKSSPLKAAPSGFEPTSPEARAAIEPIVMDSYDWFKAWCSDSRKLEGERSRRVADGRVFTGRQAVGPKLIDELGDEKTAIAWLAKEKNIDPPRLRCATVQPRAAVRRPVVPAPGGGGDRWKRSGWMAWRSAGDMGYGCARSSVSTLTVSWRFGTLRPTERAATVSC